MGPLHEYEVDYNGSPTTAMLDERDAARLGARRVQPAEEVEAEPEPEPEPEAPAAKAERQPANKARTVKDKTGG